MGYNNIQIREEDQWKAAFKTPFGLYQPTVMYFGLANSPLRSVKQWLTSSDISWQSTQTTSLYTWMIS